MAENQLTPAEIEALIGHNRLQSEVASNTSAADHSVEDSLASRRRRNRLWAIHEQAARDIGAELSSTLRAAVDVRLMSVDSVACRTLAASMNPPTCICLLHSTDWAGQFLLEMPAEILLPMLDRMLGGSVNSIVPVVLRPLSEIELHLAMRLGQCAVDQLNRAWERLAPLQLAVDRTEVDSRWLSIGPPESEAAVASFDVRLGKSGGTVRFAIPPQAMDTLEDILVMEERTGPRAPHAMAFHHPPTAEGQIELTVELSSSPITAEDVANLSVGDVIATDHRIDAPVLVAIDGEPKFLGRLGATAGRKAVRLEQLTEGPAECDGP